MKKIKSYTGIWNVEKVLYAINDFNLPFPVTFTQITWFVITEFIIILFGDIPPLSMIEGAFLKYFGIPVALTWFPLLSLGLCRKRPLTERSRTAF